MSLKKGLLGLAILIISLPAAAENVPEKWQMGFQPSVTPIMDQIVWFHDQFLLPLTIIIAAFVGLLMLWVLIRYNRRANPTPRKFSHNTFVEVIWTLVPTIIVVVIAVISLRQIYYQDKVPADAEITIKAIGLPWYWDYEYPDENFRFSQYLVEKEDLPEDEKDLYLFKTDTEMVIPVDTTVRLHVTAGPDSMIHAWAIPSFGVKVDAIPGRLNERWIRVKPGYEGVYYGQCSELCGDRHAFMPITVRVVSKDDYAAWVARAKETYDPIDFAARERELAEQAAQVAANNN